MEKEIKILLVEDNVSDIRLIQEYLKDYKDTFKIQTVSNLKNCIDNCQSNQYDVILLDLGLPDSNGVETLSKLRSNVENLPPTIVLTGFNDEDLAIKMVGELGAQDYVLKDDASSNNLRRVVLYAIERKKILNELNNYKNDLEKLVSERTDQLNENYERYKTLADASPVGLFRTDENGQCVYVNKSWLKRNDIDFYKENNLVYWTGSINEEFRNEYNCKWNDACIKKENFEIEIKMNKKDGTHLWALIKAKPVSDNVKSGYVGTIIDITPKKELIPELIELKKTFKSLRK